MKIAVCTLHINDWYEEIVKYSIRNINDYCNKHNYEFIHQNEKDPETVYDKTRDCPWYKIKLIKKVLNERKDVDVVVWIDADTHIMNKNIKLEQFIEKYQGVKDILISQEQNPHNILNTGIMFIKNTEWSKKFLDLVWDNKDEFDKNLHEQASMSNLYTKNDYNCQNHITILPEYMQHHINCYWYAYLPNRCFIFHSARCSHDKEGFRRTMDLFCPIKMDEETEEQYNKRLQWLQTESICRKTLDGWLNNTG
jgi:hypothetical protein